jgi:citrate lyase subunit beta/citryl-CoA lyase
VARLAIHGVFVPKLERAGDVPVGVRVHALLETALGLESAFVIASHPDVRGISLGEGDLRSQTGALEGGLDWARSRVVNAAVAAGLPRPPQSVYPHVRDLEGLAVSCRRGRELGHLGRAAIHPDQLPVIEQAYLPTTAEVETARETIDRLDEVAVGTLADGVFVDPAMLGGARQVLALAERYGTA